MKQASFIVLAKAFKVFNNEVEQIDVETMLHRSIQRCVIEGLLTSFNLNLMCCTLCYIFKDTIALQMLYFLKIKIFISLDSCQFVEYLFKIKIYNF